VWLAIHFSLFSWSTSKERSSTAIVRFPFAQTSQIISIRKLSQEVQPNRSRRGSLAELSSILWSLLKVTWISLMQLYLTSQPISIYLQRKMAVTVQNIESITIRMHFCSLLPLSRKLLCCPSEWVNKCNIRIRALNELCRFRSDDPRSLTLPRRRSFLHSILQKCCLVISPGPAWWNTIF